ncbi:hypothetical protein OSTOST_11205, partial [Ostertagia ostertagi]
MAIYQMRKLAFVDKWNNSVSRDQELLDRILLWLGLVGELIYSVAGLVGTQTFLIYLASRVKVGTASRLNQPGKQAITYLLAANLSIFLMNLFENFYGKRSWVFLVRSFSPLTIFYRFHSSVCLAEIWKNVVALRNPNTVAVCAPPKIITDMPAKIALGVPSMRGTFGTIITPTPPIDMQEMMEKKFTKKLRKPLNNFYHQCSAVELREVEQRAAHVSLLILEGSQMMTTMNNLPHLEAGQSYTQQETMNSDRKGLGTRFFNNFYSS